jgi:hypothetical protein
MAAARMRCATATSGRCSSTGLVSVRRRGEDRELQRTARARTFRAGDRLILMHDDAFIALAAVIADILINRHVRILS